MKKILSLILSAGIVVGCATAPEALKNVEERITITEPSQETRRESIIFNWNTLDLNKYSITGTQMDSAESLILEAASEYETDKYVDDPIDFLKDDYNIEIHFVSIFDGMHTSYGNEHIIILNPNILLNEGKLLSTAFHEFSHAYDDIMGLTPNARILHIREKEIRDKYDDYGEESDAIWDFRYSEEYNELSPIVIEEVRKSEIRAYTRQLKYLETLEDRDWSYGPSFDDHREKITENLNKKLANEFSLECLPLY